MREPHVHGMQAPQRDLSPLHGDQAWIIGILATHILTLNGQQGQLIHRHFATVDLIGTNHEFLIAVTPPGDDAASLACLGCGAPPGEQCCVH